MSGEAQAGVLQPKAVCWCPTVPIVFSHWPIETGPQPKELGVKLGGSRLGAWADHGPGLLGQPGPAASLSEDSVGFGTEIAQAQAQAPGPGLRVDSSVSGTPGSSEDLS